MTLEFLDDVINFSVEVESAPEFTPEQIEKIREFGEFKENRGEWKIFWAALFALGIGYSFVTIIEPKIKQMQHRNRRWW